MIEQQRYDLYLNTAALGLIKVAEAVVQEEQQIPVRIGLRYTPGYLQHARAFALDPVQLPLRHQAFDLPCRGGIPGILDDYLPDAWGRRVLAQLAFYREQKKFSSQSAIAMLSLLGSDRVGALQWVEQGQDPEYGLGTRLEQLTQAELAAQQVDSPQQYADNLNAMSLLYLANAGTGVGGARPKALVYQQINQQQQAWLAKFNRLHNDTYNNARVELACLNMAAAAGMEVYRGQIVGGINGREVLLLKRFDVDAGCKRHHLISVNALLKNPATQTDRGGVFRYDDIAELVRRYSCAVEKDLPHLLRVMLFNRAINNTDDHERNFSFIHTGDGYRLSPAYDMVPSMTLGAYPVAGFGFNPAPPLLHEVGGLGKIFGLPKTQVRRIAEQVATAIQRWPVFAEETGVSDQDQQKVQQVLRL